MLLGVALALAASGCEGKLVGRGEEMRLGDEAARQIERQYPVSTDAEQGWLIARIGRQVAAQSNRPNVDFTFKVLHVREINAVSVPGYVYVNDGLINVINADPDELAAIVAHEVAHTTERHMAKQLERVYGAAFLLNMLSSGRASIDTLAQIALELALRGYSRGDERAADAQGLRFMSRAGYDPWAMVRFFEQLRKETGDTHGLNRYFTTHPMTSERISRAREQIIKEHLAPNRPQAPSGGLQPAEVKAH